MPSTASAVTEGAAIALPRTIARISVMRREILRKIGYDDIKA